MNLIKMVSMRLFYSILMVGFYLTGISKTYGQSESVKDISPILLDKSALSGVGLDKIEPKNEPNRAFFQKRLFKGEDISIYIVSSESWKTSFNNFSLDEFVYILNGKSKVKPKNEEEQTFNSFEFFTVPKGFSGSWEILAGNNYHYELSVIASKRAKAIDTLKRHNIALLDKSKISGVDIQLNEIGLYEEVLLNGVELTVLLKAEKPRTITVLKSKKDQLICVLSGQVKVKDGHGNSQTFYTGDFFVLPKRFEGSWQSDGHGLFKSIVIEQTEAAL